MTLWSGSLVYVQAFWLKTQGPSFSVYKLPDHQVQVNKAGAHRAGVTTIQTPDIVFSEWYAWDDIKSIPNGNRQGLYIIARFDKKPEGIANHNANEILYIGETHGKSQSIHKRLSKFFKAARVGDMIHKHSGGNRFNRVVGSDLANMYAAGFAPKFEKEEFLNPFIFYAERKLLWEYVAKWGNTPCCNGY